MTLEQYTVLAYHFIYLTFFVPTIYDTIKFKPSKKTQTYKIDQYTAFIGKRLWNTHFGDLFVGIILAAFWPIFVLFSICYIVLVLTKLIARNLPKKKVPKNKKNKVK